MTSTTVPRRRIALMAHDNKKQDMLQWADYNRALVAGHELVATATTGRLLHERLQLPVTVLRSGPFGGDRRSGGASPTARSACWSFSGTRSSRHLLPGSPDCPSG